jgi:hypothetical protein
MYKKTHTNKTQDRPIVSRTRCRAPLWSSKRLYRFSRKLRKPQSVTFSARSEGREEFLLAASVTPLLDTIGLCGVKESPWPSARIQSSLQDTFPRWRNPVTLHGIDRLFEARSTQWQWKEASPVQDHKSKPLSCQQRPFTSNPRHWSEDKDTPTKHCCT